MNLGLDDNPRDTLLTAKGWQPHDELNGINIMGNDDELRPLRVGPPAA